MKHFLCVLMIIVIVGFAVFVIPLLILKKDGWHDIFQKLAKWLP